MEDLKGQDFIQQKLKSHFLWYSVIAGLCLVLLATSMIFTKRLSILDADVNALSKVKSSLVSAPKTIDNMDSFIKQVALIAPSDIDSQTPSHYLHNGLDRIKTSMGNTQLEIGKVEYRGEETSMPVTVSGPITNYQGFVTGLGRLQDMSFPFFLVKGITFNAAKGQTNDSTITYEIRAEITMPKSGQVEGTPSSASSRPARIQFRGKGAS
jgi:hypothetical protein